MDPGTASGLQACPRCPSSCLAHAAAGPAAEQRAPQARAEVHERCMRAGRGRLGALWRNLQLRLEALGTWLLVSYVRLLERRQLGSWMRARL